MLKSHYNWYRVLTIITFFYQSIRLSLTIVTVLQTINDSFIHSFKLKRRGLVAHWYVICFRIWMILKVFFPGVNLNYSLLLKCCSYYLKMEILTSVWSVQQPKSGQNMQHTYTSKYLSWALHIPPKT